MHAHDELALRRWYSENQPGMTALEKWLGNELSQFALHDKNIYSHKVRTKTIDSVLAKVESKLASGESAPLPSSSSRSTPLSTLDHIDDLVGARILVYHPSKVLKLHDFFCNDRRAMRIKEMTIHSHQHDPNFPYLQQLSYESNFPCELVLNNTGYSGFHYVMQPVLLGDYYSDAYQDSAGVTPFQKYELQVRTIIQETWSEVQHRLIYKGYPAQSAFAPALKSQFANLARMLNLCDNMLDTLCEPRKFAPTKKLDARRVPPEFAGLLTDIHNSLSHFERNDTPMPERFEEAEALFAKHQQDIGLYTMAISDKTLGINLELSEYFLKSGHYQEALSLFQKMEKVSNQDPWIYFRAAESCSHQTDRVEEGKRYMQKLYELVRSENAELSADEADSVLYHHASLLAYDFEMPEIADFFAGCTATVSAKPPVSH